MKDMRDYRYRHPQIHRRLNIKFSVNTNSYKTALYNAIDKVNTKINSGQGSQKTMEILKLIRDRFSAKLQSL